ncbi:hypothetical protein L1887_05444 [Cichorium endivia]|nr:hypothetical protein L1887_05444 [Cichorium endivia]
MDQMENTHNKNTKTLKPSILSKYDDVFLAYTSDVKKVNEKITADCEKFIQHYEDSCSQMDALTKSLQQREYEIKKKEAKLQKEKTKLQLKKRVVQAVIACGERLSSCKQLVNQSYTLRKVAEGLKSELEMLHKRRAELEAQLKAESFESLQTEIMKLENALQDDDDLQEKMSNLQRELIEKDEQLQDLKDQSNPFRLAIKRKNEELQDARWELIDGLKTYPTGGGIGTKIMGLVDSKPFFDSTQKMKENAAKFASLCRHLVEDPNWHPFTTITIGSDQKETIDEEDEKMVTLKAECSEEQYHAVETALIERNRYRQSGRDLMQELWNHKENREASLIEGIDYILNEWKIHKQRKSPLTWYLLRKSINMAKGKSLKSEDEKRKEAIRRRWNVPTQSPSLPSNPSFTSSSTFVQPSTIHLLEAPLFTYQQHHCSPLETTTFHLYQPPPITTPNQMKLNQNKKQILCGVGYDFWEERTNEGNDGGDSSDSYHRWWRWLRFTSHTEALALIHLKQMELAPINIKQMAFVVVISLKAPRCRAKHGDL